MVLGFGGNIFTRFEMISLSNSTYLNFCDELRHIKKTELKLCESMELLKILKKLPAYYRTQRFMSVLTRACTGLYSQPTGFSPHDPISFL
jgi:hypothetical protein